jgi:ComF family protein
MVYNCLSFIQRMLFPARCSLCARRGDHDLDICPGCLRDLPFVAHACRRCARPLPSGAAAPLCGKCLRSPPHFHRTTAVLRYTSPVDHLVQRLKFANDLSVARLLSALLAQRLATRRESLPGVIIPVPLHRSRLSRRGYNQALELARPLGRCLGIGVEPRCCRRVRATLTQSLLPASARKDNLRGAFQVVAPLPHTHVALLDDVMTTGHTLDELAATVLRAGARRVEAWVCARAGD